MAVSEHQKILQELKQPDPFFEAVAEAREYYEKNKAKVLVGADAKVIDVIIRASGASYQRAITALAGRFMPKMR